MNLKFIDLFCGIGTIRMGMEQAGHKCIYSVERDKHKRKTYSIIFGGEPEGGDITKVRASDIPRVDVWCFGFPCQDISVAGKQLGLTGERSGLFYEVVRLLQETKKEDKPRYLFIENVKNLLSVNRGLDFFNLLYTLDEVGYDAEWQLLNSKDFGVPQNRERVFIIGHLRGRSTRKVFPIEGGNSKDIVKKLDISKEIVNINERQKKVYDGPKTLLDAGNQSQRVYSTEGLSCTLKANGGGQGAKTGLYLINKKGEVKVNNALGQSDVDLIVRAVLTPEREEKRQNGRRVKEPGEPMFTLTKQDKHGVLISEATKKGYAEACEGDSINLAVPGSQTRRGRVGKKVANTLDTSCNQGTLIQGRIRRLTPKECWRLQGIPDIITDKVIAAGISDTQMYKAAGDACTVNVIYEIAKRL